MLHLVQWITTDGIFILLVCPFTLRQISRITCSMTEHAMKHVHKQTSSKGDYDWNSMSTSSHPPSMLGGYVRKVTRPQLPGASTEQAPSSIEGGLLGGKPGYSKYF